MSKFVDHCKESLELFGKPYEELHRWFDGVPGTVYLIQEFRGQYT